MTNESSKSQERVIEPPGETRASPPSDDPLAAGLRRFGPLGILAIVVIFAGNLVVAPFSALLALAWAYRSRTAWREIGYVAPRSWIGSLAIGIVFGVAFKLFMKIIVMPLLGADPINQTYHYLVANPAGLLGVLYAVTVGGGFTEETVFRGFAFERLGKLFGSSLGARTATVLLTTALFALLHYPDQGLSGVEQAAFTGLVFGTIFAVTRRIWMPMFAHAAFDWTAIAIIYWDLESKVAHLVFK